MAWSHETDGLILTSRQYRVLRAVAILSDQGERLTTRSVGKLAELKVEATHITLHELKAKGLVHFTPRTAGTLRLADCVVFVGNDLCLAERVPEDDPVGERERLGRL